jgi:hypothetical protein
MSGAGFGSGGLIDCDYQLNSVVIGIEGMFDGFGIKGDG